ncbi:hypothetical protein Enr13x_62420 [Stieleria neptunia]|uniref:Uncharacterized protein n=1 Tax=Stieleria neptunia TaxID=2527979 RepID=A0A518HZR1_9BACT|nr:hypothetical protein [Stieleria neptunia]QDV46333.1 hypothetical protein Enr13x_62420 [Stieleria neptunia]
MHQTLSPWFVSAGGVGTGLWVLVLAVCTTGPVKAENPNSDASGTEDRVADALQITTDAARQYDFQVAGTPPRSLRLHDESILKWSNPIAGEVYGNVFLWTDQGRPQVIGSIFQWYSPMTHGSHEFHSLASEPLTGARDGTLVWKSPGAGIRWQPVPDSTPPAESAAVRLRQARAISRAVQIEKTDRAGVSRRLRLLAQPLFRYSDASSNVRDGMLFVFVQGTDPEVFLMVEAIEAKAKLQWQFALVRMNSVKFVATYRDQEVWRTEIWPWNKVRNRRETYTSLGPFERETAGR